MKNTRSLIQIAAQYRKDNPDTVEALRGLLVFSFERGRSAQRHPDLPEFLPSPLVMGGLRKIGPTTLTALCYDLLAEDFDQQVVTMKVRSAVRSVFQIIHGHDIDTKTMRRVADSTGRTYQPKAAKKKAPSKKRKPAPVPVVNNITMAAPAPTQDEIDFAVLAYVEGKEEVRFGDVRRSVEEALCNEGVRPSHLNLAVSTALRKVGLTRKRGTGSCWVSGPAREVGPVKEVSKGNTHTVEVQDTKTSLRGALDTVRSILNNEITEAAKASDWNRVRDLGAFGERFDSFAREAPVR